MPSQVSRRPSRSNRCAPVAVLSGVARPFSTLALAAFVGLAALLAAPTPALGATFVVNMSTNFSDISPGNSICGISGGGCTLRAAIQEANAFPGVDTITFNIATVGIPTIALNSPLPTITEGVTINGTTQPAGKVELDGSAAGPTADGVRITGGVSTIRGLIINGFAGDGIELTSGDGSFIVGNYIGTNSTGTSALANAANGVRIASGSIGNTIGGTTAADRNVISGNANSGVTIADNTTTGNFVRGNYIGTNAAGTAAIANGDFGVYMSFSAGNTIGGTTAGARNVISGNLDDGILISGVSASANIVRGNYIGTSADGESDLGNGGLGVWIFDAPNNDIGGTVAGSRNVISGNSSGGILIQAGASGNDIQGNYIGTDDDGNQDLGNSGQGLDIDDSPDTVVGGATVSARNVISGNQSNGVLITGSGATGTIIRGNYIGTNATGTAALGNTGNGVVVTLSAATIEVGGAIAGEGNLLSGNTLDGVYVSAGANAVNVRGNIIGANSNASAGIANGGDGVEINDATAIGVGGPVSARNIISGNSGNGVRIDAGASGNLVRGNTIGPNGTASAALPNAGAGILVSASPNNTVGEAGVANTIAGNGAEGVLISGVGATGNTIQFNYIGVTPAGGDLGNVSHGVRITTASNTLEGNTISGNGSGVSDLHGVFLDGAAATGNSLIANKIGLNGTGTAAVPNTGDGVHITGPNNTVGDAAGGDNFISGNQNSGVLIIGAASMGNVVQGNKIGTDATGTAALGNSGDGVAISDSPNNTVGGTAAGARNYISGNGAGVRITGSGSTANFVQGNYIGTNNAGNAAVPNSSDGVVVGGSTNVIGGAAAGARNVISGNFYSGVLVAGTDNTVIGNYIGTDASGNADLGNNLDGIVLSSAAVGDDNHVSLNVISGNGETGIHILASADLHDIRGNYIGTNAAGTAALGNDSSGIHVEGSNNVIGGTSASDRNVISANLNGVLIEGLDGHNNAVLGNFIGTNAAGTSVLGNTAIGLWVLGGAFNAIGSSAAGAGNVIAGSGDAGLGISGLDASENDVYGNFIGTDTTATLDLGNAGGVSVFTSAHDNRIGLTGAGFANTIAYNDQDGVVVVSGAGNRVQGNEIYANGALGIDLFPNAVTLNDAGDVDIGPNNLQNFPVLTSVSVGGGTTTVNATLNSLPNTSFNIETFFNPDCNAPGGYGEGETYKQTNPVATDGSGNVAFVLVIAGELPAGDFVTATATNTTTFDTSEFSACKTVPGPGPDDDGDLVADVAEPDCGGDAYSPAFRPERIDGVFAGVDDDGDTLVDEALPGGAEAYDCDGDGYSGADETSVFSPLIDRDQDPCGLDGWPSNLFEPMPPAPPTNRLTIQDVTSFVAPVRHFDSSPGDEPLYNPRWDIRPGPGALPKWINIQDVLQLVAGPTGNPPMLNGARAFGQICPFPP